MGTIVARKSADGTTSYRAQIRLKKAGQIIHSESRTFSKRAMAQAWLSKREAELEKPGALAALKHKGLLLKELIEDYRREVADVPGAFGRTKREHLKQLQGMVLAEEPVLALDTPRLLAHIRKRRADGAGPSTVANDLIWLRAVLKYARSARGIPVSLEALAEAQEAARDTRLIGRAKRRTRRPTAEELEKLDAWFSRPRRRILPGSPDMRLVMWFALYSCRRQEELTRLQRAGFDEHSRTYPVTDLKHPGGAAGNDGLAVLPDRGWDVLRAILRDVPSPDGRLFPYNPTTISAAFTRACKTLGIEDLVFHDLRHEGCSRLAEDGATIPEIQQVSLHESWGSLQVYVNMRGRRGRRVDFEDRVVVAEPAKSPATLA